MISLSTKVLICALFALINYSDARLAVKSPETLWEQFDKLNGIDYAVITPQNKITYKRAFIGNLILAEPEDGCESIKPINTLGSDAIYNPILLIDWGECHYPQKVKNAEIAGAKMVILVLRNDMPTNHPSIKQMPLETNVEVLAVSKSDGDKLLSFVREAKNKDIGDPDSVVELTYSYDVERHVNYQKGSTVLIDYWFVSGDQTRQSYQFLEDIADVLRDLGDKVDFYPHYVAWQCDECSANFWRTSDVKCISGGRYCDPEPIIPEKLTGRHAMIENLRQICFREQDTKVTVDNDWWRYTVSFGKECLNEKMNTIEACRVRALQLADVSQDKYIKADRCIKKSFANLPLTEGYEWATEDNTYLKKEYELQTEMHVDHYPALYVNKERYIGTFRNIIGIKDFICSHFIEDTLPATCVRSTTTTGNTDTTGVDTAVYVTIIFLSIIIMAIMLYCVRRSVKRQVMGRMNDEISHIVTQYKQFKDKSNSFADEDT